MTNTITINGIELELPPGCEGWMKYENHILWWKFVGGNKSPWFPLEDFETPFVAARAALAWYRELKKDNLTEQETEHALGCAHDWERLVP